MPRSTVDAEIASLVEGMKSYFPAYTGRRYLVSEYEALVAMQEPPLATFTESSELYRFVWLRSWDAPVCVRISRDGSEGSIATKVLEKYEGPTYGPLTHSSERHLAKDEMSHLAEMLDAASFWSAPAERDWVTLDGAGWMLEGLRGGTHHIVKRNSPAKDGEDADFRFLCEELLGLSDLPPEVAAPIY
jgi:hypothetical protein